MISRDLKQKNIWPIIGNRHIVNFLESCIANGKISSAYIFLGPANLGKTTIAKFFAQSLLCGKSLPNNFSAPCYDCPSCRQMRTVLTGDGDGEISEPTHFDYQVVKKLNNKKNISIEQIRGFINNLSLSSFSDSYKIGVIKNAESLSLSASNALLKTLEEPKKKTIIILIASSLEDIPETIASRSQVLHFYPVKSSLIYDYLVNELGSGRSMAKNISRLALGRPALAQKFFQDKQYLDDYVAKAETFLDLIGLDITSRLDVVSKIVKNQIGSQEKEIVNSDVEGSQDSDKESLQSNVKTTLSVLGIWQAVARDIMLAQTLNENLIQHEVFKGKIESVQNRFNKNKLLELNKLFEISRERIVANVNPRLVLENFVCNI